MILAPVWSWWMLALIWFALTSYAHLDFSLWLVGTRDGPFGRYRFADLVPAAGLTGLTVLAFWIYRQCRDNSHPWRVLAWWGTWLACVVAFDRWLTFSINETAHYPQYALLAWLLAHALDPGRRCVVPGRIMFWTALLGALDEIQQYVWIAPAYGMHLDFNDFVVNLIAAAAGVMLYYGVAGREACRPRPPRAELAVAALLVIVVGAATMAGRVGVDPPAPLAPGGFVRDDEIGWKLYLERRSNILGSHAKAPRHGDYYILAPGEAAVLMGLFGALFGRHRGTGSLRLSHSSPRIHAREEESP